MEKQYYLGLDVGGTKVEGAVAQFGANTRSIDVLSKKRIVSIQEFDAFIDSLANLINELLIDAKITLNELRAIGIGLPGSLDPKTRFMLNGNTRFLIDRDVLGSLQKKLNTKTPIFTENDANLFVLAEAWGGAGLEFEKKKNISFNEQVAVGITLGTGVGGGFITLGKVLTGAHGSALEVGHIMLRPGGNPCYCGQVGCAETYLSGTALNKIMDSKVIFQKAKEGDFEAKKALAEYRSTFVHFLSILNNLFNPHYFVFGGGLSMQESLFENLHSDLETNIFLSKEFCPEIYINRLGDSAGLFGAMIYARECLEA